MSLKQANLFVTKRHRHNKSTRGHKFSVGVYAGDVLVGVGIAGQPIARCLDDGLTLEVNRTCTTGEKNVNSMIYGALWRAARALGYTCLITYTQQDESGSSLRAVGFRSVAELAPRKSWAESSVAIKAIRDPVGNGGVARVRWELRCG